MTSTVNSHPEANMDTADDKRRGMSDAMQDRIRYGRFPNLALCKSWVKNSATSASDAAYARAYIAESRRVAK